MSFHFKLPLACLLTAALFTSAEGAAAITSLSESSSDTTARLAGAQLRAITLRAEALKVKVGTRVYLSGTANARKGTRVVVQERKANLASFSTDGATRVRKSGQFRYSEVINSKNDRQYRACLVKRGGLRCSKSVRIDVVTRLLKAPTTVSISSVSASSVDAGQPITVSGTASANLAGKSVQLEASYTDGWGPLGSASVGANGTFTISGAPTISGRAVPLRVVAPSTTTTQASTASAGSVTVYGWFYLADEQAPVTTVGGYWDSSGTVTINGVTYPKSKILGHNYWSDDDFAEVNLGRACTTFETVVGLTDGASSAGSASVTVSADSVVKWSQAAVRLGQAYPITLDVTGALRLKLESSHGNESPTGFGSARVRCAF